MLGSGSLWKYLISLSLKKKVDMSVVSKYLLTPVPLSISHVDGTMQSTRKAALLIHLESRIASIHPVLVNTTIIDASFSLHLQINATLRNFW